MQAFKIGQYLFKGVLRKTVQLDFGNLRSPQQKAATDSTSTNLKNDSKVEEFLHLIWSHCRSDSCRQEIGGAAPTSSVPAKLVRTLKQEGGGVAEGPRPSALYLFLIMKWPLKGTTTTWLRVVTLGPKSGRAPLWSSITDKNSRCWCGVALRRQFAEAPKRRTNIGQNSLGLRDITQPNQANLCYCIAQCTCKAL